MNEVELLRDILSRYIKPDKATAFIFGSMASGKVRRSSDIDIGIEGAKLNPVEYFDLLQELEDSNLARCVQVVHFDDVSDEFRRLAKQDTIKLI